MAILKFIVRDQTCTRVAILGMIMENVGQVHHTHIALMRGSTVLFKKFQPLFRLKELHCKRVVSFQHTYMYIIRGCCPCAVYMNNA